VSYTQSSYDSARLLARYTTEKAVEILKGLEKKGTDENAINALWAANRVCSEIEFENIEKKLKEKGYNEKKLKEKGYNDKR
jgi:hypothetical protein